VYLEIRRARVVFPEPGGPHRMKEPSTPSVRAFLNGAPSLSRCTCPTTSSSVDGVVDSEGNLYLIYSAIYDEPVFGRYPTFGWFNASSLGLEEEESSEQGTALTFIEPSCNPFCGSVEFYVTGGVVSELSVYDITGRLVAEIPVADGVGVWDGYGYNGERIPTGVYSISSGENCEPAVVTLLNDKL
jgi:hypothetical protein